MAAVDPTLGAEGALAWCLLLNAAVLWAAWRWARRRWTHEPAQAAVDAGLLWYAVQYAAVGLPGMVGLLRPGAMAGVALALAAGMALAAGWRPAVVAASSGRAGAARPLSTWLAAAAGCFASAFALAYAYFSRFLPIMSNDGLTYHFPAAAQWLADGRITLFPTWFFNPANTYSPLAGSTFIAWWLAPLGNDVLARFVELPALLLMALAIYQLARQLRADIATAGLVAAAAIVARPFLHTSLFGKDDLALAFFFCAALLAMAPNRSAERAGPLRLGLALGLLLATKYTALLSVPILLLAIDGPWRAGWRWRWAIAAGVAAILAGPWFLRNALLTGNPLFPLTLSLGPIHLARGLFTTSRSAALHGSGAWTMLTLPVAIPGVLLIVLLVTNLTLLAARWRQLRSEPLFRAIALGPALGLLLFVISAPFPEARFVYPTMALLIAGAAGAFALIPAPPIRWALGASLFVLATVTSFQWILFTLPTQFAELAIGVTAAVLAAAWLTRRWTPARRLALLGVPLALLAAGFTFVYWSGYLMTYRDTRFVPGVGWSLIYPQDEPVWQRIGDLPTDAVVAYSNTYLIYPMQGFSLRRRLVYAPTRPGIHAVADLPPLGDRLTGEAIVPAAARATAANADRATWLANLSASGAQYLVIFRGNVLGEPPEARFAAEDPREFPLLFQSPQARLYEIRNPKHEIRNKFK